MNPIGRTHNPPEPEKSTEAWSVPPGTPWLRWGCLVLLFPVLMVLWTSGYARAAVYGGYSEYYLPGPEEEIWPILVEIDTLTGTPVYLDSAQGIRSIISITASGDNTKVYYDHWENGYGFDPDNPNTTADETFTLQAGQFLSLSSNHVPVNPRGTSTYYDGGDRIYVAGTSVAVTRSMWPAQANVLTTFALSWEVYPVKPLLTHYTIPVGEDLDAPPKQYEDFEQTYLIVMSVEDNNQVQIDDPRTPGVEQIHTLNRGQTATRFHIGAGTRVIAQKSVQVQFIVANSREHFEMRGYVAVPDSLWDKEYYNPVNGDGTGSGYDTDLYIYNPHQRSILVNHEDTAGRGSFTVLPNETLSYSDPGAANRYVPSDSGVYLHSEDVFWAIGSRDTESASMDWGFSLLPANFLTNDYFIGWAPGSANEPPTENGSPVFVTAVYDDTTISVDYQGDGTIDFTTTLNRLQSVTLRDLTDFNNSGMHVSASGPITLAWGSDPDVSTPYNPYMDLGYVVLPFPADWMDLTLRIIQTITPAVVGPVSGEVSTVTLTVSTHDFPVNGVSVTDVLPDGWDFVPTSAVIMFPDGTTLSGSIADPVSYTSSGKEVVEWTNSILNNLDLAPDQTLIITFDIVTDETVAIGSWSATAQAVGYRLLGSQVFTPFDTRYINVTALTIDKDVVPGSEKVPQGGQATYSIRVNNITNGVVTGVTIYDYLPAGFTFNTTDSIVASWGSVTYTESGTAGSPQWGTWDIPAGGSIVITFTADVGGGVPPGTYDNLARATGTFSGLSIDVDDKGTTPQDLDTPPGEDPEDDEDVTVYLYSLQIDKDRTGAPTVSPGGNVTYTIAVTNTGGSSVSGVRMEDSLPGGLQFASGDFTASPGVTPSTYAGLTTKPAAGATNLTWGDWTIPSGGFVTVQFIVSVPPTAGPGTYDNTAIAKIIQAGNTVYAVDDAGMVAQDADTPPGQDPEDDEDIIVVAPALTIDKDAVTASAVAGSTHAVYTVRVENTGTADATGVRITDDLSAMGADFSFVSATVTVSAGVAPADYDTLTTEPNSGDTNLTWGEWTIPADGSVELRFTVAVGAGVFEATYDNTAGASYTVGGITITIDDLGTVAQDADTPDFEDPETDEDLVVYGSADPRVDLSIDVSHIGNFQPGLTNEYLIAVSNNGPSTETGTISVTNTLPEALSYDTYPTAGDPSGWVCSAPVGQNITCTNDTDLIAGGSLNLLTLAVTVEDNDPNGTQTLIDSASVSSATPEITGGTANNTDTDPTRIVRPDLSGSTKTVQDVNGGNVNPGDILQYTITLEESGGVAASAVVVDDIIQGSPLDRTSFLWLSTPSGAVRSYDSGTGAMQVSNISVPANGTTVIIYRITVAPGAVAGQLIDNTATIHNPRGPDGIAPAPTLTVAAPPTPSSGNKPIYLYEAMSLSRTAPPTQNFVQVPNNDSRTWTQLPATQKDITIDGSSGFITVFLELRGGKEGTHTYNITVGLGSTGDTVLTMGSVTAAVGLSGSAQTTHVFNVPVTGDVFLTAGSRIVLTVSQTNAIADSPSITVWPRPTMEKLSRIELTSKNVIQVDAIKFYSAAYPGGSELLYTAPGSTFYVRSVVSDPFGSYDVTGASLGLVDSEGFVAVAAGTMTLLADSGAATRTYEYAYTVPVDSTATNWTATVSATEGTEGTVTAFGTGTLEESPTTGADLSLAKTHTGNFAVGQNHAFTLTVTNHGPEDQSSTVTVTDTLPAGLTFVSDDTESTDWARTSTSPLTWEYPLSSGSPLFPGTSLPPIVVTVSVSDAAVPSVENVATVSMGTGENHPENNTARDTVYVSQLGISKTSDAPSPYYPGDLPGDLITYTAVITNNGDVPVYDVKVVDPLPPGLTYAAGSTQVTAPVRVFRVKEYYIAPADGFTGTAYNLTLDQDLAANYFVIVQGADGNGGSMSRTAPSVNHARLSGDPFGNFTTSTAANVIRLSRGGVSGGSNYWSGVVTVVECLSKFDTSGFRLRWVTSVNHNARVNLGTATSPYSWSSIDRIMLMGGYNGAGVSTTDGNIRNHDICHLRIWPSGSNTIQWQRLASNSLATSTVMVVEWGTEWTIQRVDVTGTAGGPGADDTSEYRTAPIGPVARDHTWVWGTGYTNSDRIGDSGEAALITLGDGVNQNATESLVALGLEYYQPRNFVVYALTHPTLAVDYRFKVDGNQNDLTVDVTVDSASGNRMALVYNGCNGTNNTEWPRPMFSARYTNNTTVRLERVRFGEAFPAWVQGIDFSGFSAIETSPGHAPDDLVAASDGYNLLPGETMTVVYQASLTDPYDTGVVTNTVYAGSRFFLDPASSSVSTDVRSEPTAEFTDAHGNTRSGFSTTGEESIHLRVYDPDRNVDPNTRETLTVTVTNTDPASGDSVTITLYETGLDTGEFAYGRPYYRLPDVNDPAFNDPLVVDTITDFRIINPDTGLEQFITLTETGVNTGIFTNDAVWVRYEILLDDENNIPGDNYLYVVPAASGTISLQLTYLDVFGTTSRDKIDAGDDVTALVATRAVVSRFEAHSEGGRVVVTWETASESGTLGFHLLRFNEGTGRFERVNERLLYGLLHCPQGGVYRYVDPGAMAGQTHTYLLVEVQYRAKRLHHGPYTVKVGPQSGSGPLSAMGGTYERTPHPPNQPAARSPLAWVPQGVVAGDMVKIPVSRSDLYYLDAPTLALHLGKPEETVRSRIAGGQLVLKNRGRWVAYLPSADNNGLYFYGEAARSIYTKDNIYLVSEEEGAGYPTYIAGDVDGSGVADLADAVLVLQMLTGLAPADISPEYPTGTADTDSDGKIGLTEVIYLLQITAGMREAAGTGSEPDPAAQDSVFRDTKHFEQDLYPVTDYVFDPKEDFWVWAHIFSGYDPCEEWACDSMSHSFDLRDVDVTAGAGSAWLAVRLLGTAEGYSQQHHVRLSVNGIEIGGDTFGSFAHVTVAVFFDPALLNEGQNTVTVTGILGPGVEESVFFVDAIDLTYPRFCRAEDDRLEVTGVSGPVVSIGGFSTSHIHVFDMTDPAHVRRITETTLDNPDGKFRVSFRPESPQSRYLAITLNEASLPDAGAISAVMPSTLSDPDNRADYLIIVPAGFEDAVQGLVMHRLSRGLTPKVVRLGDIMDAFNHGIFSPEAIRTFLAHARSHWQIPPRYVVLIGEGTHDYKNRTATGGNLMPPVLVGTPDGLFASDNHLADLEGNDGVPEIAIGRLPVASAEELEMVIGKIIAYERQPRAGWQRQVMMIADNADGAGGQFPSNSDTVATWVPETYEVTRNYLSDTSLDEARSGLFSKIESGIFLLNFIGHGGYDRLADEGVLVQNPNLGIQDLDCLGNGYRMPIAAFFSCFQGRFDIPGFDYLGENLIMHSGGGAVAVWSSAALSINRKAWVLNDEFFKALFVDKETVLGDVVRKALQRFRQRTGDRSMPKIYTLLGDPALTMPLILSPVQ